MIFVDTSAFIALTFPGDLFYSKAKKWWTENKNESFITTNTVIIEALGWIRYRGGKKLAIEVGERMYSGEINMIKVNSVDEKIAWKKFKKLNGKGISMIDCISFSVMERLKAKKVFTFDTGFKKAGFDLLPAT